MFQLVVLYRLFQSWNTWKTCLFKGALKVKCMGEAILTTEMIFNKRKIYGKLWRYNHWGNGCFNSNKYRVWGQRDHHKHTVFTKEFPIRTLKQKCTGCTHVVSFRNKRPLKRTWIVAINENGWDHEILQCYKNVFWLARGKALKVVQHVFQIYFSLITKGYR